MNNHNTRMWNSHLRQCYLRDIIMLTSTFMSVSWISHFPTASPLLFSQSIPSVVKMALTWDLRVIPSPCSMKWILSNWLLCFSIWKRKLLPFWPCMNTRWTCCQYLEWMSRCSTMWLMICGECTLMLKGSWRTTKTMMNSFWQLRKTWTKEKD